MMQQDIEGDPLLDEEIIGDLSEIVQQVVVAFNLLLDGRLFFGFDIRVFLQVLKTLFFLRNAVVERVSSHVQVFNDLYLCKFLLLLLGIIEALEASLDLIIKVLLAL
uniref:Uncharacterized protein n=1 Tax=Strombidium inclinatum TaxID=197538 RepID=A0A7S3IWB8_9SPIT